MCNIHHSKKRETKYIDMIAFCCLLVAAVGSLAEGASTGGSIDKLLIKVNHTLQAGVSGTSNSIDQILSLTNTTVNSVAGLVSTGSDKVSTLAINGLDAGGDLSKQAIGITQDTINEVLNVANNLPIGGKVVSVPNGIISKVVNVSSELGRDALDMTVGAGEASAAIASAMTTAVSDSVANAASKVTGKLSSAYDKGFGLLSKGISKTVEGTSGAIHKVSGLLPW